MGRVVNMLCTMDSEAHLAECVKINRCCFAGNLKRIVLCRQNSK
jgi:hypothetical protein